MQEKNKKNFIFFQKYKHTMRELIFENNFKIPFVFSAKFSFEFYLCIFMNRFAFCALFLIN